MVANMNIKSLIMISIHIAGPFRSGHVMQIKEHYIWKLATTLNR